MLNLIKLGVIKMLNSIKTVIAQPVIKAMLEAFVPIVKSFLITKTVAEVQKYAYRYFPVGGAIFGRRYAITLTLDDEPPPGHPKAIHLGTISNKDWGFEFHLWGVSFPKERWEKLPESAKVKW